MIDKLQVEMDAQHRIIANLEQRVAAGDVAAADQIAAAEDTMRLIGKRLDEIQGGVAAGTASKVDLETQPRLFSKEDPTRGADPTKAKNWEQVQDVLDKDPADVEARLKELGYRPVKYESGQIWKINRLSHGAKGEDY